MTFSERQRLMGRRAPFASFLFAALVAIPGGCDQGHSNDPSDTERMEVELRDAYESEPVDPDAGEPDISGSDGPDDARPELELSPDVTCEEQARAIDEWMGPGEVCVGVIHLTTPPLYGALCGPSHPISIEQAEALAEESLHATEDLDMRFEVRNRPDEEGLYHLLSPPCDGLRQGEPWGRWVVSQGSGNVLYFTWGRDLELFEEALVPLNPMEGLRADCEVPLDSAIQRYYPSWTWTECTPLEGRLAPLPQDSQAVVASAPLTLALQGRGRIASVVETMGHIYVVTEPRTEGTEAPP